MDGCILARTREDGGCPLLRPAAWPALGFAAFTIILKKDLDKARAGWSERMIKKTLNSF